MTTKTTSTIWVCTDCVQHAANGECGGCDPTSGHDRTPLGLLDGEEVTLGLTTEEHDCDDPETCGEDGEGCARRGFSWSRCEGCGSQLGGDREAMTVWTEREPNDKELRGMIRMDMGDSYNLHLPDGTQRGLGFCAEGPLDHSVAMLAQARKLYDEWKAAQA